LAAKSQAPVTGWGSVLLGQFFFEPNFVGRGRALVERQMWVILLRGPDEDQKTPGNSNSILTLFFFFFILANCFFLSLEILPRIFHQRNVPSRYGMGVAMLRQVAPATWILFFGDLISDPTHSGHSWYLKTSPRNRQSVISLAERCSNLSIALANRRSQHPIPNYANLVEVLVRLLNEIDQYLRKFIKPTSLGDQSLWYGMLNSFADFGIQIDKAISDLSFGVLVNVNQSLEAVH
jgi:hypothetical protein